MNDVLKQRLVGALVIIVLGVAFWPIIFADPNQPSLDRTPQVPPLPRLRKMQLEPPQALEGVEPAGGRYDAVLKEQARELERQEKVAVAEKNNSAQVKPSPDTVPDKPELDSRKIPVAWVVQVITVAQKKRASALAGDLIKAGYKAYFRPIEQDGETLYKVYVGPQFERKALQKLKQAIDKEMGVNSIIARYVP